VGHWGLSLIFGDGGNAFGIYICLGPHVGYENEKEAEKNTDKELNVACFIVKVMQ
jgi:hypothetical protein